jgi:hypothetical protein
MPPKKNEVFMKYSKQVMSITELTKMGFPRSYLERACHSPSQQFAFMQNPFKKRSVWLFDTEQFEIWRQQEMNASQAPAQRNNFKIV